MGETTLSATSDFDDDDEDEGTGTYVVIGIFDEEDSLDLTPAYGPFDDIQAASDYGTRNYAFSWVCEIVPAIGSVQAPAVHPNQFTIADYIDPSVVE